MSELPSDVMCPIFVFQDFAPAYNALGFYEINMKSNYSGGVVYFNLSAKGGDRDGLFNMGVATDNGWIPGTPRDKVCLLQHCS